MRYKLNKKYSEGFSLLDVANAVSIEYSISGDRLLLCIFLELFKEANRGRFLEDWMLADTFRHNKVTFEKLGFIEEAVDKAVDQKVIVYDRFLFAVPVEGTVRSVSDKDGAYEVEFDTDNPGGKNVTAHDGKFFHHQQCRLVKEV